MESTTSILKEYNPKSSMSFEEQKCFCIVTVGFSSQNFPVPVSCHSAYQTFWRSGPLLETSQSIWSEKSDYNSPSKGILEEAALYSQ